MQSSALAIPEKQQAIYDQLSNQVWRLNNLYWIRDKHGKRVKFKLNPAQRMLLTGMHYLNVILKARQLGFTTFIDIYILDVVLFNPDVKGGIIAHHKTDAEEIYTEKIKYPWDNLDPNIKGILGMDKVNTDRVGHIKFPNGSSIRVSTSFRSGTLQLLHVSEFGKIAVKYPEKAKEIITGAFEAVADGQFIFVESTAEGQDGYFFEMVQEARASSQLGRKLTAMEWKFHFFPWWQNKKYVADPEYAVFTDFYERYFLQLEARRIFLSREQKAWYILKRNRLKDTMLREYPSYPEEAFFASIEGAYYQKEMGSLRREGRIGNVPHDPMYPVHTFWDLGMSTSAMAIWFFQATGREYRLIRYYEDGGEGFPFYAKLLSELGYNYGTHYMPHDINVRDLSVNGLTRKEVAESLGIRPIERIPRPKTEDEFLDQIEMTRTFLSKCWIDETLCADGIKHLDLYKKDTDADGTLKSMPKKTSPHNHGADSLRTGAAGFQTIVEYDEDDLLPDVEYG